MKKLKLNLDELKVESFETTNKRFHPKGTIWGEQLPATGIFPLCQGSDIICAPSQLGDCTGASQCPGLPYSC